MGWKVTMGAVGVLAMLGTALASWSEGEDAAADELRGERIVTVPLQAAPARTDGVDYDRLEQDIDRLMDERGMVGLAIGVVENGEIAYIKGFGETVAGSGEPVTTATMFRWASLSKGVAGTMAAKLDAETDFDLDHSVTHYSNTLQLEGGTQFEARMRDVLSHRLGLWRNAYDDRLEDGGDADEIRRSLGDLPQICPVGTCWSYQNVAFDAASEAVEKVTGETYEAALQHRLFAPLGMDSANASLEGLTSAPDWAHPHNAGAREIALTDSYYRVPAAGGVNSDIVDLTLWMQAQMGLFPDVLTAEMLGEAHEPLVNTPSEMRRMRRYRERLSDARYGLGWRQYDYAGHHVVGHRGGVDGYRGTILFDPERKFGVVALWNSSVSKPHGLPFLLFDMVYGLEPQDWLRLGESGESAG
ncbi:serine hydrolase domain-containing protein [Sphingomicrobium sediminis]|uniref:Beta-lactamase family protein n=1 Tax=Sphingomicrobium sediminis TaxID=2950949 RepID=A0A9X2J2S6_9SPHN|nr:serine hydrolase domain-containing protein [Sphingomicrobium sediminis]MCM8557335.1 beta-lactamase family protein [Sphingomicrobium sediminis]